MFFPKAAAGFFCLIIILSLSTFVQAQDKGADAKPELNKGFTVALTSVKASGRGFEKLSDSVKAFFTRDSRYTVVSGLGEGVTHTLAIEIVRAKGKQQLKLKGALVNGAEAEYVGELSKRPSLAEVEAELSRGLRELFDYQPAPRKIMLRIVGTAEEGDADGGSVEDAIFTAISSEFEQVLADPYKLPVKDKDVPALYKGDKKKLAILKKDAACDLLVVGTVHMPATKNVGGAQDNRYRGKAEVRLRVWDLARHMVLSEVKMDLNGEGIFSELLYSLFDAASVQSTEQIKKDLGFPVVAADAGARDEE